MDRREWRQAIYELSVFDTHTHLNKPGVPISAQTFWDIAHYFWFLQELWSVGYPRTAAELPEGERIERFASAFNAVRNTHWHRIVCHICLDLYGVSLVNTEGLCTTQAVLGVDAAVRERATQPEWAQSVVDALNIRKIAVNELGDTPFPELPNVAVAVPVWDDHHLWLDRLMAADDPAGVAEEARGAIGDRVTVLADMGIRGMRIEAEVFNTAGNRAVAMTDTVTGGQLEAWQAEALLAHACFAALSEHAMFAQLFLGIERDVSSSTAMAVNDPRRITDLYPLLERYDCGFELVLGSPQNNMDAAQAARIYPNAHVGGLWWYNFRRSTYNQAMQVRVEAVPASKSAIIASDARCIEWCYGKILLVKWFLADFLHRQVQHDWLSEADALWVAREWLHDAAARRYVG
jgi:hypothetical protein